MDAKKILEGMATRAVSLNDILLARTEEFRLLMLSFGRTVAAWEKGCKPVLDLSASELHFVGKVFRFVHDPALNLKAHFVVIYQRVDDINAASPHWRSVGTIEMNGGQVTDDKGYQHKLTDTEAAALPVWVRVFNAIDNPNGDLS